MASTVRLGLCSLHVRSAQPGFDHPDCPQVVDEDVALLGDGLQLDRKRAALRREDTQVVRYGPLPVFPICYPGPILLSTDISGEIRSSSPAWLPMQGESWALGGDDSAGLKVWRLGCDLTSG
jgi:hypothetical protein